MSRLLAPAKLTWSLEVTGVRPSDGYHELRAEMMTLDLADVIEITESEVTEVTFGGVASVEISSGTSSIDTALALVKRHARVRVDKVIPAGGGLGGGSADAAAVLRWANFRDVRAASAIGADVPFCLVGGRAMVSGIGEVVEPLDFVEREVSLLLAPFGVSTPACYRAYDDLVRAGRRPAGRNHLREAAETVEPRLTLARQRAERELGVEVHLAGSGSTMFVEGPVDVEELETEGGTLRVIGARAIPAQ